MINPPQTPKQRKPRKLPVVLNEEEFLAVLKNAKTKSHKLAYKLGFLCGLRVSEIVKLQPSDVDHGRRMLFIRQGKGGKDRFVPFPERLSKELGGLPVGVGKRALEIAFKKSVKKAGIMKDLHFHNLRHSSATYYLSRGMNIVQVQQLLGHSRIDTTTIYLSVSPDNVKNAMDEIWK
jgi:integrase/recombinase XerD